LNAITLRLLRDFLHAYGKNNVAPYDWSFEQQETCEKLQMALQHEIAAREQVQLDLERESQQ
jgi:hypothetical protein